MAYEEAAPGSNRVGKMVLEVPHHWQKSEHWGLDAEEARRICALICLKIVLDYKNAVASDTGHSLDDIKAATLAHGGKTENGWLHAAEVKTLRAQGLNAWRRDWNLPAEAEATPLIDGYEPEQVQVFEAQKTAEAAILAPDERAKQSIIDSITQDCPVIASVAPGFSENGGPHQVVIHGYDNDSGELNLFITDPVIEDKAHQELHVSWQRFLEYFKYRAIFVGHLTEH